MDNIHSTAGFMDQLAQGHLPLDAVPHETPTNDILESKPTSN